MTNTVCKMLNYFGLEIDSLHIIFVKFFRLSHLVYHAVMTWGLMDRVCAYPFFLLFIRLCDATALALCNLAMCRIAVVVELALLIMRVGNQVRVSQESIGIHGNS